MLKHSLTVLFFLFTFISKNIHSQSNGENIFNKPKALYKIISVQNNTYGYDVFIDNKLKIHQENIPGLAGKEGFKTKELAEKVAKLVIEKINNGIMPPSISIEEMKQLKVI